MKRMGRWLALALVCAVVAAAPWAMKTAAVDVRDIIRPQEETWEGVISIGIVPTFALESAGKWLKTCAGTFMQQEKNITVTLREMTKLGVQTAAAAQAMPDVLVHANGVFAEREAWMGEDAQLAAGRYVLLGNTALLTQAGWTRDMTVRDTLQLAEAKALRIAVPRRDYADPMAALLQMGASGEGAVEDLYARVWPDFALEGKYALYVATQREAARMDTLHSAGRGVEAVRMEPEAAVDADLKLMWTAVQPDWTTRQDDAACAEWVGKLRTCLVQEEAQNLLESAGLCKAAK